MAEHIRVAVMGCGHIGALALHAIQLAPDMRLAGLVDQDCRVEELKAEYPRLPVVASIAELPAKPDVAVLCIPTRSLAELAPAILEQGIDTIDCFDLHGQPFINYRAVMDAAAKKGGSTAVLSSGVDPGISTQVRALFEIWAPTGLTYVRYGPGMSMGHTVAAKSIPGVRDALSITRPGDPGVHKREVYIELETGARFEEVRQAILSDAYFASDDVRIFEVDDVTPLVDTGHRIEVFRKGSSSGVDNELLNFVTTFNNPASTAQIMVASARAARRMPPGAHSMLEIPLLHFLPGDNQKVLARLV